MLEISFGGAALAGLLSFLSPCILPMVPFYLSYMAGVGLDDLRDGRGPPGRLRARLVPRSLAVALGVTTIFVLFGLGATAIGRAFAAWKAPLSLLAAGVLVLFGLHVLGVLRIGLLLRTAQAPARVDPQGLAGSYGMGLAFGFGWTPCAGPALAAILLLAGGMGEPWRGGVLLLTYGLAMTLPFVLVALFSGPVLAWIARHRALALRAEKVMGALLILFGILIATGQMSRIGEWMMQSFDWSATLL